MNGSAANDTKNKDKMDIGLLLCYLLIYMLIGLIAVVSIVCGMIRSVYEHMIMFSRSVCLRAHTMLIGLCFDDQRWRLLAIIEPKSRRQRSALTQSINKNTWYRLSRISILTEPTASTTTTATRAPSRWRRRRSAAGGRRPRNHFIHIHGDLANVLYCMRINNNEQIG